MTNNNSGRNGKYRGVEVNPDLDTCCQAARDIAGRRFLTGTAPMFPLDGCDAGECLCSYQHFNERRRELRRLSDFGFDMAAQVHENDRRAKPKNGRRQRDQL